LDEIPTFHEGLSLSELVEGQMMRPDHEEFGIALCCKCRRWGPLEDTHPKVIVIDDMRATHPTDRVCGGCQDMIEEVAEMLTK